LRFEGSHPSDSLRAGFLENARNGGPGYYLGSRPRLESGRRPAYNLLYPGRFGW
jgi:hypothetical protein